MTKELEFLLKIVKDAEKISNENFSVEDKIGVSNGDMVTDLDVKIEKFLISQIKKEYPKFDIVSEEFNFNNKPTKNCFIIDPIDGTINFANGLPFWAIQVACVKNGKTVAAVVDMPRIHHLFYADKNGAFLNDKQIHVKQVPLNKALYVVDGSDTLACFNRVNPTTQHYRRFGAVCTSMAFVSAGFIHGAVFRSDKVWDYAPGMYISQIAGAEVADEPGFHAVAMNKEFMEILKKETAKQDSKKNIFVLHSLNGDTLKMWGGELQAYFSEKGIEVLMPQFPIRADSSYEKFDKILSSFLEHGKLNSNSIVVAHSIGNPYFIRFCRQHKFLPKAYVAVAPRLIYRDIDIVTRKDYMVEVARQAYTVKEDVAFVKKIKNKVCLYSDEEGTDPKVFENFLKDTGAKEVYLKGYNHFDGYHRIYKIPELIDVLNDLI